MHLSRRGVGWIVVFGALVTAWVALLARDIRDFLRGDPGSGILAIVLAAEIGRAHV